MSDVEFEFHARIAGLTPKDLEDEFEHWLKWAVNRIHRDGFDLGPAPVSIICPVCKVKPLYDFPTNKSAEELAKVGMIYHEPRSIHNVLWPADRLVNDSIKLSHRLDEHSYLEKLHWFVENYDKYHDAGPFYTKWVTLKKAIDESK